MKKQQESLYRLLAAAAVLCAVYPPVTMANRLLGYGVLPGVGKSLVLIGIGLLGFAARRFLERTSLSGSVKGVLLFLLSLLAAGSACALTWGRRWYELLIAGGLACLLCCLGGALGGRKYSQILSETAFTALSIFFLVVSFTAWCAYAETPVWIAVCFYAVLAAVYGLIRNQENIERLTVSRHFTLDFLPERIRSYNFSLLVVLLAAMILLFVVAGLVAGPFDRAMDVIRNFVNISMHGQAGGTDYVDPILSGGGSQSNEAIEEGAPSALALLLAQSFQVIVYAGVIGLLIALILFNRDRIFELVSRIYRKIRNVLHSFAKQGTANSNRHIEEDVPDYVDVVQSVQAENGSMERGMDLYREWRRAYKRYLRMEDSGERYRMGYSLAVKGLALSGVQVQPSDTTLELADKSGEVLGDNRYRRATELYNGLYYGPEEYTPGNLQALDSTLQELRGLGKRKRPRAKRTAETAAQPEPFSPVAAARRQSMGDLYREPEKEKRSVLSVVLWVLAGAALVLFAISVIMSLKTKF